MSTKNRTFWEKYVGSQFVLFEEVTNEHKSLGKQHKLEQITFSLQMDFSQRNIFFNYVFSTSV